MERLALAGKRGRNDSTVDALQRREPKHMQHRSDQWEPYGIITGCNESTEIEIKETKQPQKMLLSEGCYRYARKNTIIIHIHCAITAVAVVV